MSLRRLLGKLVMLLAPCALLATGASAAWAQSCGAAGCGTTGDCGAVGCAGPICVGCAPCQKFHCPPPLVHCTPNPPCIKFKCACPKPACDPCDPDPTGHYYYTPTCWRPAMAPPNYSHCPIPTPTQIMPHSNAELHQAHPVPMAPPAPERVPPAPPRLESRQIAPKPLPAAPAPVPAPVPPSLLHTTSKPILPPPPATSAVSAPSGASDSFRLPAVLPE